MKTYAGNPTSNPSKLTFTRSGAEGDSSGDFEQIEGLAVNLFALPEDDETEVPEHS